ncbi:MAG: ECF-type sigma factor [Vicinamibacteria bacterium]|nr:ECF-type sigma factor [Vicinamibacteria bacterium]
MSAARADDVTRLLNEWSEGDRAALDALIPLVQQELRRSAARHLRRERSDHTLQATALVNEVYLRLADQRSAHWQNRLQFYAVASRLMRRILIDYARRRRAARRGAAPRRIELEDAALATRGPDFDLLALDEALDALAAQDERQARMVELRYFGGLSVEDTAEALQVSPSTVKSDWRLARAWLRRFLAGRASA